MASRAMKASTQAAADPRMQGRCAKRASRLWLISTMSTAAASGRPGISQRMTAWTSNMALLLAVGRLGARGGQARQLLLGRRRRGRLLLDDRLLVGLSQVLPQAHVQ